MGGEVGREFIHARIYGQYGKLLTENDYELLARRQSPGERSAGFLFKDISEVTATTREIIFKEEMSSLQSILQKNRRYRRLLVLLLRLYEIENLKNAMVHSFRFSVPAAPWYDISLVPRFRRESLERDLAPEDLHEMISSSHFNKWWPADPPEDFSAWMHSFELLEEKVFSRGGEKIFGRKVLPEGREMAVFSALSLSMQRLTGYFLQSGSWNGESPGGEDVIRNKKGSAWYRARHQWLRFLETRLREKFYRERIMADEEIAGVEKYLHTLIWNIARKNIFLNFHYIETVTSFLILRIYQMKNFFAIAEGLRLGMKPEKIMSHIITGR